MNRNKLLLISILLLLLIKPQVQAEVTLPKVLGSNMVLQQNKSLSIWGFATAGEVVTVSFGNQSKKTNASSSGRWEIVLDPLKASFEPAVMTISGTNTIELENILVGEVWLCSGQSNMEYSLGKSSKHATAGGNKGPTEAELEQIDHAGIRIFLVRRSLYENSDRNKGWEEADFEAVKDVSAAGYFFADKLNKALNVPVGIIAAAIPGSPIERWAPEEVFAGKPDFKPEIPKSQEIIDDMGDGKFYYGMIQPLAPFALAGFLWYQGETNCFKNEGFEYTDKMQALINTWRYIWKDDHLPFYYVQIAPFYYSHSKGEYPLTDETLPRFWEAQTAALQIPHTGMVVTTDLVDDLNDIHPPDKWEVGNRLALCALGKYYDKDVVYSGPMFEDIKIKREKVIVKFSHTGSGLKSYDGQPLTWFEVAGSDGVFVPAQAGIKGKKVVVSAKGVSNPVAVRFAWNEAAQANLYNKEGLPAVPFRSNGPKWDEK